MQLLEDAKEELDIVKEPLDLDVPMEEEEPTNGAHTDGTETEVVKDPKDDIDEAELEAIDDLERLLDLYTATLGRKDLIIFNKLKNFEKELDVLPLFGPKRHEAVHQFSNPLAAHTARSNLVLQTLSDNKAFLTAINYDEDSTSDPSLDNPEQYDLRFILPILSNAIDETNVFDPLRVVNNGWVYFIMRGLCMKSDTLRRISFLCYKRLLFGFHQPKYANNGTVKLWVHFLSSVKRGIGQLESCRLSNLLSTWLVAAWEIVKKPSHSLFTLLTSFLMAKPVVEMTIIPEFIVFYNAGDGNKESREWILNVMYLGLQTEEDWKIALKLPVIKFLCSSFVLEKVAAKKNILGILNRGAQLKHVANLMVEKYSLPLWLANIPTNNRLLQERIYLLFYNLKTNSDSTDSRNALNLYVEEKLKLGFKAQFSSDLARLTYSEEQAV